MGSYAVDHSADQWLLSTTRKLGAWTQDKLKAIEELGADVSVEMSFPDTSRWTKETPLSSILVHFERDDMTNNTIGFGQPSIDVDNEDGTTTVSRVAMHTLNFDVGVWVSAEMGGATKRMVAVQALANLFSPGLRQDLNDDMGVQVVSFEGGNDMLDRINDVPVWRTATMTLIVRVFSTHTPDGVVVQIGDFDQEQKLTLEGEHIITDDEPWT